MQHAIAFEASEIDSSAVAGIIDALLKGCAPSKSTGSARPSASPLQAAVNSGPRPSPRPP
jgi:hypothetical protein